MSMRAKGVDIQNEDLEKALNTLESAMSDLETKIREISANRATVRFQNCLGWSAQL